MKIVPDTSAIIHGILVEELKKIKKNVEVIIPIAALDELQAQASKGREVGFIGLEQLKEARRICRLKKIKIRFEGERPSLEDIKLAHSGRIDAIIREVAKKYDAYLYTCDYVQALVAEAVGVKVKYFQIPIKTSGLKFEDFFTEDTISVHLKENCIPLAKRGKPGNFKLVKVGDKPLSYDDINEIIREISEAARISEVGNVEINRNGALVIQLGKYRIAIARPPFSNCLEVTIVRPIVKLSLEDYKLSEKLIDRLKSKAEGIIIAGPPGSGKTTFAASLAEFYKNLGKVVKTLESPRDMQVSEEITQYGPLEGDFEKSAEILLLVRPDYTIFDEVRKTRDFEIFADLRLAGVGMVGVVHASDPIDAIQRFISRLDIGVLPHVVDTIIFVKEGMVKKVLVLSLKVKVPTGMTMEDLARPVVEVRDFETGKLEYEIYTYGEEKVVVPIEEEKENSVLRLAKERIYFEIKKYDPKAKIEILNNKAIVEVDNRIIGKIIGKNGENISKLENKLGISIEVVPKYKSLGEEIEFSYFDVGNSLEFIFDPKFSGKVVSFYIDGKFLFTAMIGKKGRIKISKESDNGKALLDAISKNREIKIFG